MKINIDKLTQDFNTLVLPGATTGMSTTKFSDLLALNGFPYKCFWPIALEDVGYLKRGDDSSSKRDKRVYFDADPAVPGRLKPLHRNECAMAWEVVMKHHTTAERKYTEKKFRHYNPAEQNCFEQPEVSEAAAVALLKSLGYRLMKPTTTYEEV